MSDVKESYCAPYDPVCNKGNNLVAISLKGHDVSINCPPL